MHTVSGKIRDYWAKAGWEKSPLGFPSSDPYTVGGGVKQNFIGGSIQAFEPTGVALEKFDNKAYSSYRQVYPLFAKEDLPRWHAAGAHRELIQNMDKYFPLTGCPREITKGAVCILAHQPRIRRETNSVWRSISTVCLQTTHLSALCKKRAYLLFIGTRLITFQIPSRKVGFRSFFAGLTGFKMSKNLQSFRTPRTNAEFTFRSWRLVTLRLMSA